MIKHLLLCWIILLAVSCETTESINTHEKTLISNTKYAKGFNIYETETSFIYETLDPSSLKQLGKIEILKTNRNNQDYFNNIIPLSATHISYLDKLDLMKNIKGVTYSNSIFNKDIQKGIKDKSIRDIGSDNNPNKELILEINPSIVFSFPFSSADSWIEALGYRHIPISEYLETHPLAQAEWITFFGHLFNKESIANEVFNNIEQAYNNTLLKLNSQHKKPAILTGELYDNMWTLPGGKSITTTLIEDAGGNVITFNDTTVGSRKIDFEIILDKQDQYDKWIFISYTSLSKQKMKDKEPKYNFLDILNTDNVFVCNSSTTPYFEQGILEPHIILLDLINIFSDSVENNTYFKRLN